MIFIALKCAKLLSIFLYLLQKKIIWTKLYQIPSKGIYSIEIFSMEFQHTTHSYLLINIHAVTKR